MAMSSRAHSEEAVTASATGTPSGDARASFAALVRCVCDGARLMVGVPSYDAYVEHMRRSHPAAPAMTYAEFFRARQDARYGARGSGLRCC
jgi:uncharacterized short protein YbdD (DUF466 family)